MLMYFQLPGGWQLNEVECMRDYTFHWSDKLNRFLNAHKGFASAYFIYAGLLMDGIFFMFMYANHQKSMFTLRILMAFLIFYFFRTQI